MGHLAQDVHAVWNRTSRQRGYSFQESIWPFLGNSVQLYLTGHVSSVCEGWWPGLAVLWQRNSSWTDWLVFSYRRNSKSGCKLSFWKGNICLENLDKGRTIHKSKMMLAWKEISQKTWYLTDRWNHIWLTCVTLTWTRCWKIPRGIDSPPPTRFLLMCLVGIAHKESS